MRTLKEEIRIENELEMLTESVVEKHIQKLIDQLKRYGISPKELFKIAPVAWDKIDASRVTVYRDPSDKSEIKEYSDCAKDENCAVFGILNGQVGVMFYNGNITYLPTDVKHKGKMLNSWDIRSGSEYWRRDNRQRSIKTKAEDMLKISDEVWVINIKGKLDTHELKRSRVVAQQGVWDNTPEFYADWLKKNIQRYKKKIEVIRAQKNDDFVPLSEKVMQTMELISKEMIDMHKNSEHGQWGYNSDLRYALSRINSRCQYAFNHLDDILRAKHDLEEAKRTVKDYGEHSLASEENYISTYSERYNSNIQALKSRLQEIEEMFEEYKQEKENHIEKLNNRK
jgi:hypothetical protein